MMFVQDVLLVSKLTPMETHAKEQLVHHQTVMLVPLQTMFVQDVTLIMLLIPLIALAKDQFVLLLQTAMLVQQLTMFVQDAIPISPLIQMIPPASELLAHQQIVMLAQPQLPFVPDATQTIS